MIRKWMVLLLALLLPVCACASAQECAICSGDRVCDTCGGLGYQLMTAYGSGEEVRVACMAGCEDGKCPDCFVECDICLRDGLCDVLGYLTMKAYGSGEEVRVACTGNHCAQGVCTACSAVAAVTPTPKPTATPTPEPEKSPMDVFITSLRSTKTEEELRQLPSLEIEGIEISSFDQLEAFESLDTLELVECTVTSLQGVGKLKSLTSLSMTDCTVTAYNLDLLAQMPSLTKLVMIGCGLDDLSFLKNAAQLTELWLGDNQISRSRFQGSISSNSSLCMTTRSLMFRTSVV